MILLTRPFLQLVSTDLVFLCLAFAIILCPDLKYSCVSTILTSSLHSLPAYTSQWLWAWSNSAEGFLDLPGPAFSQPLLLTPNYGTHTICQMSMLSCPVRKMKPQTSARSLPSVQFSSVQFTCSVVSDSLRPHESQHSTPGLPVHHHLPEFTQTHVHRVSDAIQPSHPRLSPSPPVRNPSQHQRFFQ